jgi:hypothetical protein
MSDTATTTKQWSKTELRQRGWTEGLVRRLLPEPSVEERRSYTYGRYTTCLWDADAVLAAEQSPEFLRMQARREKEELLGTPKKGDLLAAIFTVNRAAKRQRDLAQKYYLAGQHGLAGASKEKKEKHYCLKDSGIAAAYQTRRLACVNKHANLYLYRGEGYSFHSTLCPVWSLPNCCCRWDRNISSSRPSQKERGSLASSMPFERWGHCQSLIFLPSPVSRPRSMSESRRLPVTKR